MIADTQEKLRSLAAVLHRLGNVFSHRRGRAVERTSFTYSVGILQDLALTLDAHPKEEVDAIAAALDGVTIAPTSLD